jgi:hypothetical protein
MLVSASLRVVKVRGTSVWPQASRNATGKSTTHFVAPSDGGAETFKG